jgi:hypothetical protein
MSNKVDPGNFVYFPDTDEKKYIVTERLADGRIREYLVSEEENDIFEEDARLSSERSA